MSCEGCSHYKTCKTPCKPVAQFIGKNNFSGLEKKFTINGQEALVNFGRKKRELRFSDLSELGLIEIMETPCVETEPSNDIAFDAKFKRTEIFIKRFFLKWSNKDVAEALGCSDNAVAVSYGLAKKRILKIIKTLDDKETVLDTLNIARKKLSPDEKAFLLNKVFGFAQKEIAEMPGFHSHGYLREKISKMTDEYKELFQKEGIPT